MTQKKKPSKSKGFDKKLAVELYEQMFFFRKFEEKVGQSYTKQKFSGFCHLHIGQEAVASGIQAALRNTDYMIGSYRSHTQAIGKGIPAEQVMAELYGKQMGCCKGKGGSMHMFSNEHRFLGGHGIVGGQVPIAAGVGFQIKYNEQDDVCVCYLGDAAANQGQFFEALNMSAAWDLPVLYVIENNKYGMGTDIKRVVNIETMKQRGDGVGMANSDVDGMNVITVYEHVKKIVDQMRKDKKPHLLEVNTYRYRGHSVSDPATYRTKEEVSEYQSLDPLIQQKDYLVKNKILSEDEVKELETKVKAQVKDVEKIADEAEPTRLEEAWTDVLIEG